MRIQIVIGTALLSASLLISAADLGTGITYQGELEVEGGLANGEFDFEFELFDADVSGVSLAGVVTVEDVTVVDGLFVVEVDFGTTPYAGDQLWLDISVREGDSVGGFTNLLPRQKVTAAPYALHAEMVAMDAIGSAEIANNAVGSTELANSAVGSNQIDPSEVQLRVAETCAGSTSIRGVNQDGTVICSRSSAGLDFDKTPTSTSVASISTCTSRTTLKQVSVTVPASDASSYVVCRASGRTFHSQTAKWVFYSIDDELGTGNDVFAYTGIATTTSTYNNYDPYAMQEVYTISSSGGTSTYYLKVCRQDTSTTGTAYHDDFTCELHTRRY